MDFIIIKIVIAVVNIQEDNIPSEIQTYFDCGKLSTSMCKCPTAFFRKRFFKGYMIVVCKI